VLSTLHARLRVHWAPGIPHALYWAEGFMQNSGETRREIAKPWLRTMRLFET
jgi:hypothetical protein